jgi:hypothetical protein
MYRIIGADGKEYGPISADQVRSWIAQGRLNAQSKIKSEDAAEWKALAELPDFAGLAGAVNPPPLTPVGTPAAPKRLSALAIVSLVLGVLGLISLGLAAIPGLVLGIVALLKIRRNPSTLSGTGLAIAGICVSGLMLLMLPLMAAMLLPALARAKSKAQTITCMNNMKQLNLALLMYATDHKDRLPPADKWCDLIQPYTGGSTALFHCPTEAAGRCSYAYNAALGNQLTTDLKNNDKLVLVFTSSEGWNQAGGSASLTPHAHDKRRVLIGYADGHVEVARPEALRSLLWEP